MSHQLPLNQIDDNDQICGRKILERLLFEGKNFRN